MRIDAYGLSTFAVSDPFASRERARVSGGIWHPISQQMGRELSRAFARQ